MRGSPGVSEGAVRKLSRSNWRALIGLCGALARAQDRRRGPSIRQLPGLHSRVRVDFDRWANPTITADSRNDALQALGYLTAHERLFQLDLFRRVAAGRMAEIVGPSALEADRQQRVFGFAEVAAAIVARLPPHERSALEAYVAGVNASIAVQRRRRPLECLLLGYRPEPWTCGDSMLVALLEFQDLTWAAERDERALTVMDGLLPPDLVAFLTPGYDRYATLLLGSSGPELSPVPPSAIRAWPAAGAAPGARPGQVGRGSNAWAVTGKQTASGAAMLAVDMHTQLTVPNSWYRACLRYDGVELVGVTLPGLPLMAAGATNHLAWGFTNATADVLDLVRLEVHANHPDQYRLPNGWETFGLRTETIRVRGRAPDQYQVQTTIWGPVLKHSLLGQPVALRWSALDPAATSLGLLELDAARTVEQGIEVLQKAAGPPLQALLADSNGHIGWTLCGAIPRRIGFDGSRSVSWSDGAMSWSGYVEPGGLPMLVDPPSGRLMAANNRVIGEDQSLIVGHNFASGYRAYRIARRLQGLERATERDLLAVQLDDTSDFYLPYLALALECLGPEQHAVEAWANDTREALRTWSGRADTDQISITILARFRERLIDKVLKPLMARCTHAEPGFDYAWGTLDEPLLALLEARDGSRIGATEAGLDWAGCLRGHLARAIHELLEESGQRTVGHLTWARFNRAEIRHPLSRAVPWLSRLLDMPPDPLPGSRFSIRAGRPSHGASMRMVVAPGRLEAGILHMPAGQSGRPLSPHYDDQHAAWLLGRPLPLVDRRSRRTWLLEA